MNKMRTVANTTWDELTVGASASMERTCAANDLFLFAHVSGNSNPLNLPHDDDADPSYAPAMWVGSLISAVLGTVLPGTGTLYRSQNFEWHERVQPGETVKVTVTCIEKREKPVAVFATEITKMNGTLVLKGQAIVSAPLRHMDATIRELPSVILDTHDHFTPMLKRAAQLPPMATAVVCPDDPNALKGAVLSFQHNLIVPILIGDKSAIQRAADAEGLDISAFQLIDEKSHHEAAAKAVAMVRAGDARSIMKGNIHSDTLLGAIVKKEGGLRGDRRISHAFVMDVPTLDHLLVISDAAINIAPDLVTKVDITQNAIDLALAIGIKEPRTGILSAVETVNPNIPSTIDAAVLAKMADRGQIKGGIVDGPLAMDNAIDMGAARTKGITSLVAGRADILIVPNLEAGNMLVKELTFIAMAETAGLVLGARAPIILTSRADNDKARLASSALAQLYDYYRRERKPFAGNE
jgi:phosphotransacetylase/acyl dehydratase